MSNQDASPAVTKIVTVRTKSGAEHQPSVVYSAMEHAGTSPDLENLTIVGGILDDGVWEGAPVLYLVSGDTTTVLRISEIEAVSIRADDGSFRPH